MRGMENKRRETAERGLLRGLLRPSQCRCGQAERKGKPNDKLHAEVAVFVLTKGSIMPTRAAILSCTSAPSRSESEKGVPIVKLRSRSN